MNKNAKYSSKYRNKNIDKIRQKDKERKKFWKKYIKYCDEKHFEEKKEKIQTEKETYLEEKVETDRSTFTNTNHGRNWNLRNWIPVIVVQTWSH